MSRHHGQAESGHGSGSGAMDLATAIDALIRLPRSALVERWRALHRSDPPKGISRRLLIGAVAYTIQAQRHGGLRPTTLRRLAKIAAGRSVEDRPARTTAPGLRPGARIIREWNGATHRVEVVEDGYLWNGERYRSLSAVARAITGARWSGPRFFDIGSDAAP